MYFSQIKSSACYHFVSELCPVSFAAKRLNAFCFLFFSSSRFIGIAHDDAISRLVLMETNKSGRDFKQRRLRLVFRYKTIKKYNSPSFISMTKRQHYWKIYGYNVWRSRREEKVGESAENRTRVNKQTKPRMLLTRIILWTNQYIKIRDNVCETLAEIRHFVISIS